ncbi:DUF2277 domain-containing protein [Nocardia otitidiscaviarum]|uniref:DUF2277 domain-containing protein n=1 Tax=Nocardia otitidiscaviarum TaxID=1823 RepID=A0A378YGK7_9NOCA|nr:MULTISPECIES: DUF2277 domain-containing protein [Nocardia]MBF6134277.1 DUF2277 domain-containing protein [Nocardia otitidiscaviarum]MBF6179142.1 DUF2277 domain-containing protein [Nocardia otitidiscaviarum]MBF6236258.1 DUF2277 domain-containing protein [Nocardia otitidiscaviarum]MBF6484060.1 DUF2277 domain-containing protein [Nocardia otitidiscaviarum]MCP9621526.1 DUF2277 domain-containing protein [Nocardia otitidiscaviarum]
MSRNITLLRGLEPPATEQEIFAAAQEYVRKVGGVSGLTTTTKPAVDKAVAAIAAATTQLLAELPARGAIPETEPQPVREAASGE